MYAIKLVWDGYVGNLNKYATIKGIKEDEDFSTYLSQLVDGYTKTPCGFSELLSSFNEVRQHINVGDIQIVTDNYKPSYYDDYINGFPTYSGALIRYDEKVHIVDDFGNLLNRSTFELIDYCCCWDKLDIRCAYDISRLIRAEYKGTAYLFRQANWTVLIKIGDGKAEFHGYTNKAGNVIHNKIAVEEKCSIWNTYYFEDNLLVPKTLVNRLDKFLIKLNKKC